MHRMNYKCITWFYLLYHLNLLYYLSLQVSHVVDRKVLVALFYRKKEFNFSGNNVFAHGDKDKKWQK